jgi:hypothetical protein
VRASVALYAASRGVHDVYATLAHGLSSSSRRDRSAGFDELCFERGAGPVARGQPVERRVKPVERRDAELVAILGPVVGEGVADLSVDDNDGAGAFEGRDAARCHLTGVVAFQALGGVEGAREGNTNFAQACLEEGAQAGVVVAVGGAREQREASAAGATHEGFFGDLSQLVVGQGAEDVSCRLEAKDTAVKGGLR